MDVLTVPSTSASHLPSTPLRTVRSTGSLHTTPRASAAIPIKQSSGALSASSNPPDLSYSSSNETSNEIDPAYLNAHHTFQRRGSVPHAAIDIAPSPERVKGETWRSTAGGLGYVHIPTSRLDKGKQPATIAHPGATACRNRVRLDSVFSGHLPGFPYLNSAAAALSMPALHPVSPYGHHRPPSSQELRTQTSHTWIQRSRSVSALGSTRTASSQDFRRANRVRAKSASIDLGSSCSGGSNSSDDVDLDLSWDLDVLRNQQRAAIEANERRLRANELGLDAQSSDDALPDTYTSEAMQRYRLAGRKHQSKSAHDLRESPLRSQCSMQARYSGDPALYADAADKGWSFAATPPLSTTELVNFAEMSSGVRRVPSPGEGAFSRLLRKRKPSQPSPLQIHHAADAGSAAATLRGLAPPARMPSPALVPIPMATESSGNEQDEATIHAPVIHPDACLSPASDMSDLASPTLPALSPNRSGWNSPISTDGFSTPQTSEFDNRYSQYSMQGAAEAIAAQTEADRDREVRALDAMQDKMCLPAVPEPAVTHNKTHARRSSSIFRFPFASLRNPFRPGSPSQPGVHDFGQRPSPIREESGSVQHAARAESPSSSSGHLPSEGSHEISDHSEGSGRPPLGASKRISRIISKEMMRPGPNTGLGINVTDPDALRHRQSSLPVLSFSLPSDEGHSSSGGHSASSGSHVARGNTAIRPRHVDEDAIEVIQELAIPQTPRRISAGSAPPDLVHFARARRGADSAPLEHAVPISAPATITSYTRPSSSASIVKLGCGLRRKIELIKPAQLLFFAAFLLGPWCFFIGGWCLRSMDGEHHSVRGTRCRCPSPAAKCKCQANVYQQVRLCGGRTSAMSLNGQPLTPKMDRYVYANRVGAIVTGTLGMAGAVAALIVLARAW